MSELSIEVGRDPAPVSDQIKNRNDRNSIQSVDRALSLLEALAEMGGETTLTALSERTSLNISTCHHLLATLTNWGYVARVNGRRAYALGPRIFYLSHVCLREVDLPRRADIHLQRINQASGETVHLAALQGSEFVTLATRESHHAVRVNSASVGKSNAAHATATGKAILAWLPETEIARMISHQGMTRFTPKTIVDFAELIEELRQVRRDGFAMDHEEFQPGVICVGAAIRDHTGAVVGSMSASAPTMRACEEHVALMRDEVTNAARALSAELGEPDSQSSPKRSTNSKN